MKSNDFQGITNEYRLSDEYKTFMKNIKEEYPRLPLYLAEMAISAHMQDPQLYKTLMKEELKPSFKEKAKEAKEIVGEYNLVKIYKDEEEFKKSQELVNEKQNII